MRRLYLGCVQIVYPIGVPVFFFTLLFRSRNNLLDPDVVRSYGFLYKGAGCCL